MAEAGLLAAGGGHADQLETLCDAGFALAMQLLKNRDDAKETVQECLCTVLRKRSMFDRRRGELRSWFFKIVRNRCLDLLRRNTRRQTEEMPLENIDAKNQQPPDAIAEEREMLELLKTELMNLPLEQREMILLRDFHGLGYGEIAEVLSIPPGTVMSRLHRARNELRRRMERFQ